MLPQNVKSAIEAFASMIGLSFEQAEKAAFTFEFERSGSLSFTSAVDDTRVLISLAKKPHLAEQSFEERAFEQAGIDETSGRQIHAGMSEDGSLVLAMSVETFDFDLPTLEDCLQGLLERHKAVLGGQ